MSYYDLWTVKEFFGIVDRVQRTNEVKKMLGQASKKYGIKFGKVKVRQGYGKKTVAKERRKIEDKVQPVNEEQKQVQVEKEEENTQQEDAAMQDEESQLTQKRDSLIIEILKTQLLQDDSDDAKLAGLKRFIKSEKPRSGKPTPSKRFKVTQENLMQQKCDIPNVTLSTSPFKFQTHIVKEKKFQQMREIYLKEEKDSEKYQGVIALARVLTVLYQLEEQSEQDQQTRQALTEVKQESHIETIKSILSSLMPSTSTDPFQLSLSTLSSLSLNPYDDHLTFFKSLLPPSIKTRTTNICLNCSHKTLSDTDHPYLTLPTLQDDYTSKLTVRLRIMYISETHLKQYEIPFRPGEYSYQEVMHRIKEKVQVDRHLVKSCKRLFILVDLLYESTMFGQMFTNEQMKFTFRNDQVLTAYAYEMGRAQRERVKRYHFVHIAKTDREGRITYHSYPVLVNFQESEPLKAIAMKIFKGLKELVQRCLMQNDALFSQLGEQEAFAYCFGNTNSVLMPSKQPYEMVLVLKDDSRWKLDPQQSKRLNQVVEPELIDRFEAIFPEQANFDQHKAAYKEEIDKQLSKQGQRESTLRDLNSCIKKFTRFAIQDSQSMENPCPLCKMTRGTQKLVEITKFGQLMAFKIAKCLQDSEFEFPIKLQMDRFLPKQTNQLQQSGNDFEIVGCIGKGACALYNNGEAQWIRYRDQEQLFTGQVEEQNASENSNNSITLNDCDFVVYRRSVRSILS
ncbi:hypothetical protein FGO68_gene3349 [Halteria grandinella]|uniref:Uncharacterized protein n=1 Tax=Halteria grandinella TaxID=5974 RepID=A0A8J8P249_HALGN|nr:hypothetical protein FGO68_gene3349 [Halteria grandinella]